MKLLDIFKQNPLKTWKWVAIIFICLFGIQTCSKCSHRQNSAFAEKGNQVVIDSLKQDNTRLHDSVLVLNGDLQFYKYSKGVIDSLKQDNARLHDSVLVLDGDLRSCERSNRILASENEHLQSALERSQNKPVIIYKETNTGE
jgi:hypothetical protein